MTRTVVARNALPQYLQDAMDAGSDREVCPRCDGGTHRERSLSIRPDRGGEGVVTFKCFRATCGWFAITLVDKNAVYDMKKVKQGRVYRDPTLPLDDTAVSSLIVDYGLDPAHFTRHGWRMTEDARTLVIPVWDAWGRERGHITRSLYETPKRVYTYKATAQPFLDWWFNPTNSAPVVVVEDVLSACRLYQLGYNAVALLGTGMSRDDAQEIEQVRGGRRLVLALDRDAFDKAIKLKDRHAHILSIDTVLCLEEDIKNTADDHDIERLIDG